MNSEIRSQMLAVNLDAKTVNLELHIYKPQGDGPFPTLIFNHGSTGLGTNPDMFKWPIRITTVASFFVNRGWAVIAPARRGRASSEGIYDEGFNIDRTEGYSVEALYSIKGAERALQDIDAVMEEIPSISFIDSRRLLIGGVSRGGILSVAYAGQHTEKVLGVVNFVGGWIGSVASDSEQINQTIFRWGANFKKEMLWLYGDNDSYYPLSHSRKNFETFQQGGGDGRWHEFELPEGINGHALYVLPTLWSAKVEHYLKRLGLPYEANSSPSIIFEWPDFQHILQPTDSISTIKAVLPELVFSSAKADINPEKIKLCGIWEGWMGYDRRSIDVKVGFCDTSKHDVIVEIAQGSESKGLYNEKIALSFDGDFLKGKDSSGTFFFLEVRPDGHMNIGMLNNSNLASGVLEQTQA